DKLSGVLGIATASQRGCTSVACPINREHRPLRRGSSPLGQVDKNLVSSKAWQGLRWVYPQTSAKEGSRAMDFVIAARDCGGGVATILWIIAAIFVIGGIVTLVRGAVLYGIVLIIIGLLIGPGGISIFC